MIDRRQSIFNWNHISDKLTKDQISIRVESIVQILS